MLLLSTVFVYLLLQLKVLPLSCALFLWYRIVGSGMASDDTMSLYQNLLSLALCRPSARIHLAAHSDRVEDPALGAAWSLHQLFVLGNTGNICSWCGDLTWVVCKSCQLSMGKAIGYDRVVMGVGHCNTCFAAGIRECRECSGQETLDFGTTETSVVLSRPG